jgi:Flp pilus assembly protein TadB
MNNSSVILCSGILLVAAIAAMAVGHLLALRVPRIFPFARRRKRLAQLGFDYQRTTAWVWTLLLVNIAFTLLWLITSDLTIIVLGAALLQMAALNWGLRWTIQRRERLLRNQLSDAATSIAGVVTAGTSPALAVGYVAARTPVPLQAFLMRVAADYQRGVPLGEALQAVERTLALDSFSVLSSAVCVTLQRGGRLNEALERIATALCQQQALDDKLTALTASGRSAIVTLTVFPVLFIGGFYWMDPYGYNLLLEASFGQALCVATMATVFFALRWAKVILDRVA